MRNIPLITMLSSRVLLIVLAEVGLISCTADAEHSAYIEYAEQRMFEGPVSNSTLSNETGAVAALDIAEKGCQFYVEVKNPAYAAVMNGAGILVYSIEIATVTKQYEVVMNCIRNRSLDLSAPDAEYGTVGFRIIALVTMLWGVSELKALYEVLPTNVLNQADKAGANLYLYGLQSLDKVKLLYDSMVPLVQKNAAGFQAACIAKAEGRDDVVAFLASKGAGCE